MTVPLYQYSPLHPEIEGSIRLLQLFAGDSGDPLHCALWHTALTELPEFDALSYVWGSTEELDPADVYLVPPSVQLGDVALTSELQRLPISSSLCGALRRLRLPNDYRVIWVDALCINQSDPVEKSQQVPMMGKIYHRARSVLVWLGEEANDSDLALSFIPQVTDLSRFDRIIHDQGSTHKWYALSKMMNRPWFSRRWVVQELAFAREAKVYCGNGSVDWALFADAATLFGQRQQDIVKLFLLSPDYNHDAEIFGEVQALGALRLINALNRLFRRSDDGQILEGLVSLETLVTSLNVFQTKICRDCIYAVISLSNNSQQGGNANYSSSQQTPATSMWPTLPINYNLPFHEVARGFVASCIRSSNSLDIICRPWAPCRNYYYSNFQSPVLSSWACTMDDSVFEIRPDGHYVRKRGDSFVGVPGRLIYQASRGFPYFSFDVFFPRQQEDPSSYFEMAWFSDYLPQPVKAPQMMVKGWNIGTVGTLGERAMEGTIPSGWFRIANWYERRQPVPEAFWRTLVADRGADGGNAPSWYKRAFEHAFANSGNGDVRLQRMIIQSKSTVTTELLRRVQSIIWNRRFVLTSQGAFGLVPANATMGDVVMVLYGLSVPVVLRKLESSYWLVGECYIHGAMDGVTLKNSRPSDYPNVLDMSTGNWLYDPREHVSLR
ncbi:HET-domain-containing protein [Hyaloscypha hepaticicola]|uniref:HET-domain-containing protein n=1 Tax=Hyaloscypha hepaticicola TaxID=2082293 RepID=A0A2J6PNX7_9HELO|nr:HET-domain-containing protein [Hyaloscypha hepaticicola]